MSAAEAVSGGDCPDISAPKEKALNIRTIDFEASCLPRHGRSFPIEVGVAGAGAAESWLIRPHESWEGWDWTRQAEALHGLSLERIRDEGLPVEAVFEKLTAAVKGCRVVADSVIDQYWLETLAAAAGAAAPFFIDHVSAVLDEHGADEQRICAAVAFADERHPVRHRARCDAEWLACLIHHVSGRVPAAPAMWMRAPHEMAFSKNL